MAAKWVWGGVPIVVMGCLVLWTSSHPSPVAAPSAAPSREAKAPPAAPKGWYYHEQSDPMHDEKIKFACVDSTNEVRQQFPYKDSGAVLCLRENPGHKVDLYVLLNAKGQILCERPWCPVNVRFDQAPPTQVPGFESTDHSTNILFFRGGEFVEKIKAAKVTLVEISLYQNGTQALAFPTAGLKWLDQAASLKP